MSTICNLRTSLRRLCAIPTSPTLRFSSLTSLRPHHHTQIKRIPLVVSRTSSTSPSSSKLVVSGELKKFPLGKSDFSEIRMDPGMAYFDKTEYIPVLENGSDVQLVCRPRRFGKSLTVTTLRYFHGFEFRNEYDQLFKVGGCEMLFAIRFACIYYLC
jgi:hypothetical protein